MKKVLLALLTGIWLFPVHAQTTNDGIPLSWNGKLPAETMVPLEKMPAFDLQKNLEEDALNELEKTGPWRFGHLFNTNHTFQNSGQWIRLSNGDRVWRMGFHSPGALTINFILEDLFIPEGAKMYLYNADHSFLIGAYTSINNNEERTLGTELVNGERVYIEYYEPANVSGQGSLKVAAVVHGYKDIVTYARGMWKGLNDAGRCNYDVNCPLGNGWEDQAKGVAMIVVNGNGACTGSLVNNTNNDGTAYFLTANHCFSGSAANWAFRFNWNSPNPVCATNNPSTNGPTNMQTSNGATLRARNAGTDVCLVEINNAPSNAWGIYFNGWDRSGTAPTNTTAIHHPSGDVKKITRSNSAATQSTYGSAQCWRVGTWNLGTTEPGSSGSPLFDQNKRIIGQLYGGSAACSGINPNNQPDYYGRFDISWDGSSSSNRLRDWLDPSGSNPTTLDGYDPNASTVSDDAGIASVLTPTGILCQTNVTPEVVLRNYGTNALTSVTILYNLNGGTNQSYSWTGNLSSGQSVTVTLPTLSPSGGANTFNVSTSLPNGVSDNNTVNDSRVSTFTTMANPRTVQVNITTDCWGSETTWEIRQGSTVLHTGGPYSDAAPNGNGTLTSSVCLEAGQCYTFRIIDEYGDGLYGSQYSGCNVNGNYNLSSGGQTLIQMLATNGSFGASESQNFCLNPVSVNELEAASFRLYPNPSNGSFRIELDQPATRSEIRILNLQGQLVLQRNLQGEQLLHLSPSLSSGIYFVEVSTEAGKTVQKLVIE